MAWEAEFVAWAANSLDERVRESLWERGASDEQIGQLQVGYVDQTLPDGIEFPESFLKWSSNGTKLVDNYVFPLTTPLGDVRGFQFRSVDRAKKDYIDFFLDHGEPCYFGMAQAMPHIWATENIGVVEGGFDLFPVQRVAPFFISTITAKVSALLLRLMKRVVRRAYIFYDDDTLGRRVTEDVVRDIGASIEARPVTYPSGVTLLSGKPVKDPGELWEAWGDVKLEPYLRSQLE